MSITNYINALKKYYLRKITIIKTNNIRYDTDDLDIIVQHHFYRKKLYVNYIIYDGGEDKWKIEKLISIDDVLQTESNRIMLINILCHIKDNIPFAQ